MKVSIIGTGVFGVSLAFNIAENKHQIVMWSENKELINSFNKTHCLKSITNKNIPKNITITNDLKECLKDTELIIMATSAKYLRSMCHEISKFYKPTIPICIASKGLENDTCSFLSDIISDILHSKYISVISGPTFAVDLINLEPCALSLAATNKKASKKVIEALKNDNLKLRINYDIYGTQICGSIKNVIAIASGILDGLGYKESTRAFLITESIHDIKELLQNLECNPKTILSFAGIGDLMLTCSSPKSRNYQFGVLLGKKKNPKEIEKYLNNNTTEGYYTLYSIKELIKNRKVNIPIINIIYDIAILHKDPFILVEFLMNKD